MDNGLCITGVYRETSRVGKELDDQSLRLS